jgi:putrescine aminotransferase
VTLSDGLVEKSAANGKYFLEKLQSVCQQYPALLVEARGLGLMIGVEFASDDVAKLAIGSMVHNGVIAAYTLNNPNVIRFEPPLVITQEQIDTVLQTFTASLEYATAILRSLEEE